MTIIAECMEMAKRFCESSMAPKSVSSKWTLEQLVGGIFWIVKTGAQWRALPENFPPRSTVHRWFQKFIKEKIFLHVWREWVAEFYTIYKPPSTGYVDAMFVEAKLGGDGVGKTKIGKGTKIMLISNNDIMPMSVHVDSANPHEIKLLNTVLEKQILPTMPLCRLVGDGAYDSDRHDKMLAKNRGIELIAPHKKNRINKTQDGRKMKIYKKRHKIENLNAHLQNYRRVVTRYERKLKNFESIVHLICWSIVCKKIYRLIGSYA